MSTKQTIKHSDNYHLFTDVFDEMHVYLQLTDVQFEVSNMEVTVLIPIRWAKELGLIK